VSSFTCGSGSGPPLEELLEDAEPESSVPSFWEARLLWLSSEGVMVISGFAEPVVDGEPVGWGVRAQSPLGRSLTLRDRGVFSSAAFPWSKTSSGRLEENSRFGCVQVCVCARVFLQVSLGLDVGVFQ